MNNDLKPYPSMKLSGVPWLGDVPVHWEVARLKGYVADIVDNASARGADEIYLALEHVESWTGRFREAGQDVGFDNNVNDSGLTMYFSASCGPTWQKPHDPIVRGFASVSS